jgi:hypothetical protein
MGQYYQPCSLEKKQHVLSHDYDSGLKLMEHSWKKNGFVNAVASLIAAGGEWHGDRIVWAGDYADPERSAKTGKLTKRNLYDICDKNKIIPDVPKRTYRYFLNLDTNEFVDINKAPNESDGWQIHPLPLLTCEGNGRGGGDFHREHPMLGKWARCRVVASFTKPKEGVEIFPDFTEQDEVKKIATKTKQAKQLRPDMIL